MISIQLVKLGLNIYTIMILQVFISKNCFDVREIEKCFDVGEIGSNLIAESSYESTRKNTLNKNINVPF